MNLARSDEERMLAESAAAFLRARRPGSTRDLALRWRELAELGWLALPIAERHGGLGAPDSTLAVLLEEFGRARATEPLAATLVFAAGLLGRLGGPYAADTLAAIARGECLLAAAAESGVVADRVQSQWQLRGALRLLVGGAAAQTLLVPARDAQGVLRLFAVEHTAPDMTLRPAATIDDSWAADVALSGAPGHVVADEGVAEALAWAIDRATGLACADALGAVGALIDATVAHTRSRHQFGRSLSAFQVVEHQLVDMFILQEEARAAVQLVLAAGAADPVFLLRAASAAKVKVGQAARAVAHTAVQLHGAMGVTDELEVGLFVKRLLGFQLTFGTRDAHLERYAELVRGTPAALGYLARSGPATRMDSPAARIDSPAPPMDGHAERIAGPATRTDGPAARMDSPAAVDGHVLGIDLNLDDGERAFQAEVGDFLRAALPPRIRRAQQLTTTVYAEADIAGEWHRILHRRGWSAPNWPTAAGGTGWTPTQRYLFAQESGAAHAPTISPIGLQLVGPVLMHFGDARQQQRYLPRIVSGEELWCQGFSEPGAGSDLAALATRAVRDGEDYLVSGSKIWTTHAHVAQFMAALVRTGPAAGRRDGITFLIIDLRLPGIHVRPIATIGGDHEVNQVFFDQVRIPCRDRVGLEGQGWEIAKFLLDHERGGDINSAGQRALLADLREFGCAHAPDEAAGFWRALAEVAIDVDILEMLELRSLLGAAATPAAPSMLKVRASEIQQAVAELAVRGLGREALRRNAHRPLHEMPGAAPASAFTSRYLNSRATTIFGGAREIQKGIIGRSVLPP